MECVLITGNLGYIGLVLTEELLKENYDLIGIDTNFYSDYYLYKNKLNQKIHQIKKDIRDIKINDLKGVNFVIHLAALSNDPLGKLNPNLTNTINFKSSLRLAKLAKKANVSRFLLSSSCSIYGDTKNEKLNE
ncbi:MAG: NAD-dependent epimerase/dehydratase family protein, partial [Promethearchaeota archaeon]